MRRRIVVIWSFTFLVVRLGPCWFASAVSVWVSDCVFLPLMFMWWWLVIGKCSTIAIDVGVGVGDDHFSFSWGWGSEECKPRRAQANTSKMVHWGKIFPKISWNCLTAKLGLSTKKNYYYFLVLSSGFLCCSFWSIVTSCPMTQVSRIQLKYLHKSYQGNN